MAFAARLTIADLVRDLKAGGLILPGRARIQKPAKPKPAAVSFEQARIDRRRLLELDLQRFHTFRRKLK